MEEYDADFFRAWQARVDGKPEWNRQTFEEQVSPSWLRAFCSYLHGHAPAGPSVGEEWARDRIARFRSAILGEDGRPGLVERIDGFL